MTTRAGKAEHREVGASVKTLTGLAAIDHRPAPDSLKDGERP